MRSRRTRLNRELGTLAVIAAAMLLSALSAPEVRAQPNPNADQLNQLMQHRREMSTRAVEETTQRRFEDRKSDTTFPSDVANARKSGVLRALTPEEQKALQHNERGMQLFAKGKPDDAIKEYQKALLADPKLAAAHNNLGTGYFAVGRFAEAAASFTRACELDTDYGQAFFNLALAQIKLGKQKEANDALDAALRAYNSVGLAYMKDGRLKEAEEAFRGMLQIDPGYAPALLRLGIVCNASGRYTEAAQNVRRVTEREPRNSSAHEILAEALYGEQKYEEAVVSAERALKISPDSPDALYLAGLARAQLGQREAALAHLNRLQQLKVTDLAQQLSDFIGKKAPSGRQ
jgi:tetratricopeptide (TPR) repeat protein